MIKTKQKLNGSSYYQSLSVAMVQPNPATQEIYPVSDPEVAVMVESFREFGMMTPVLVRKISANVYRLINGEKRRLAAILSGMTEVMCNIVECPESEEIVRSIVSNNGREKTWFTKGMEVLRLHEYATREWMEITKENPELERVDQWIADQLNISPTYVFRLRMLMTDDADQLHQLDRGELKSFHQAWMQVSGAQPPPKPCGLNADNVINRCNCPIFKIDGEMCPMVQAWIDSEKEGGLNVAA